MTQDRHDKALETFYKEAITKGRAYLAELYPVEDCFPSDKDAHHILTLNKNSSVWRITANGKLRDFKFYIAIPQAYHHDPFFWIWFFICRVNDESAE